MADLPGLAPIAVVTAVVTALVAGFVFRRRSGSDVLEVGAPPGGSREPPRATSTSDEIARLWALRQSGALTEAEFEQQKQRLLTLSVTPPGTADLQPQGEGCDLILLLAGDRKIEVIKLVREWTRFGLKEALDLVQSAPAVILTGLTPSRAADYVEQLRRVGARAEVRTNEKPLPETGGASER